MHNIKNNISDIGYDKEEINTKKCLYIGKYWIFFTHLRMRGLFEKYNENIKKKHYHLYVHYHNNNKTLYFFIIQCRKYNLEDPIEKFDFILTYIKEHAPSINNYISIA